MKIGNSTNYDARRKNGDCLLNDPGSNDKRAKARKRGNRKTIKSYNLC